VVTKLVALRALDAKNSNMTINFNNIWGAPSRGADSNAWTRWVSNGSSGPISGRVF